MSAAAVVRSACHALRRPLFPRALMERQPLQAENFGVRRFHSSDCTTVGKPAGTKDKATVEDDTSVKFNRILGGIDDLKTALIEDFIQEDIEEAIERGTKVLAGGAVVAGVVAAVYVKRRFFGGDKEEDKKIAQGKSIKPFV